MLAPCPTTELKDHSLLAIHNCLFDIFIDMLHVWRPSLPSSTQGPHINIGSTLKLIHKGMPQDKNYLFCPGFCFIMIIITPWSRALLERPIIMQLVKNFLPFMEPEGSLSCLLVPILNQKNPIHIHPPYL
jgi:hypothetical protein